MAKGDIRAGSVSYNSATGAVSSTNLQTYAAVGDLGLFILGTANEPGGNRPPTSFTQIVEAPGSPYGTGTPGAAGAVRGEVFVARFTEALENDVNWGDSGDHNVRLRLIIEGAWDAIPTLIGDRTISSGTTSLVWPNLADVPAGSIVYFIAVTDKDAADTTNFSAWAAADLASITEIHDQASSAGFGSGIGIAGGTATAGGLVNGATATADSTDTVVLFSLAIPMSSAAAVTFSHGEQAQDAQTVDIGADAVAISFDHGEQAQDAQAVPITVEGPEISWPIDRGRVDLANSGTIIDSGNLVVELGFLPSEDHDGGSTSIKALIMYARVQGVLGLSNLRFKAKKHPTGGHYLRANGRLLWRETGSGWQGWQTFDNGSGGSGADKLGWNNTPFAIDDIEVVYGLPLPIGEHQAIVDGWAATPYAIEPASSAGGGSFRCGTIGGTNFADDRSGGTLDGVSLYQRVIELRDDSTPPPAGRFKALVAMGTGLHASEDPFSYAHAFGVDEWLNDADLRARFDLYLLPIMAPSGRYTGRWRGTSQIAARPGATGVPSFIEGQDLNNDWNDTVVFSEEIHNLRVAIAADNVAARLTATRGGWLDWHTDALGSSPDLFAYVGDPAEGMTGGTILPYADPFTALADYTITTGTGPSSTGTTRGFFEALGVKFSVTLESGGNVANYYALAEDVGRGTMQGLGAAFDAGLLGGYAVSLDDGEQSQSAETVSIGLAAVDVALANGEQSQDAETLPVGVAPVAIAFADGTQTQDADTVDVAAGADLIGFAHGEQTQSAETVLIGVAPIAVALADGEQLQSAETIDVTTGAGLVGFSHGEQAQDAETVGVSVAPIAVALESGTQLQDAETINLAIGGSISIAHGEQLQSAETIGISVAAIGIIFAHGEQLQSAETVDVRLRTIMDAIIPYGRTIDAPDSPRLIH